MSKLSELSLRVDSLECELAKLKNQVINAKISTQSINTYDIDMVNDTIRVFARTRDDTKKIRCIQVVGVLTGLGLKESKDIVDMLWIQET